MLIAFTRLQPHLIVPQFPPVNINVHNKLTARKLVFLVGKGTGCHDTLYKLSYLLLVNYMVQSLI